MTALAFHTETSLSAAAEQAARGLVTVRNWGAGSYINMPLIYPDGSHVTVKLEMVKAGTRVSDGGFAYRVLEAVGAHRSFAGSARSAASGEELNVDRRMIFVDVPPEGISRAICDVAAASWATVDRVFSRLAEQDADELDELLRARLSEIFPGRLTDVREVRGSSTTDWHVSAVVNGERGSVVFQAVSAHPNSINKASVSFLDLAGLETPPSLVAVVPSKAELGPRLSLLSQAGGRVIETDQSEEAYRRAAA